MTICMFSSLMFMFYVYRLLDAAVDGLVVDLGRRAIDGDAGRHSRITVEGYSYRTRDDCIKTSEFDFARDIDDLRSRLRFELWARRY